MQEQPEAEHEGKQARESQCEAPEAAVRQAVIEQPSGQAPKKGYFHKLKNWVSLFTLIFVGAYTVLTFCTLHTAQEQVAISRDVERRQLRAYVGLQDAALQCPNCRVVNFEQPVPTNETTVESADVFTIWAKNGGLTPAENTFVYINWESIDPGKAWPTDVTFEDRSRMVNIVESKQLILPGASFQFALPVRVADFNAAINHKIRLIVYGHADYSDIFGCAHVTDFCLVYEPTGANIDSLKSCPESRAPPAGGM
jgi:hypothetical protein